MKFVTQVTALEIAISLILPIGFCSPLLVCLSALFPHPLPHLPPTSYHLPHLPRQQKHHFIVDNLDVISIDSSGETGFVTRH